MVAKAASTIMDGIIQSQRMLIDNETQYMALRSGMSDDERDVSPPDFHSVARVAHVLDSLDTRLCEWRT